MEKKLFIYNTLTRKKELFEPLNPPFVGMYVCGPTVYGDPHLGHARPYVTFDVLFRLLKFSGYKVRYVRNITDVGHLENDADEGEDKIAKKARLEQLEPMEVVQHYTLRFHKAMELLNTLPPSIEPHASGHIIEQIEMIKEILAHGLAYVENGSVYFDVKKYNEAHQYGKLSGRKIEDLLQNTRKLEGQEEKHSSLDFALWKKAKPSHIMRWPSPWSEGFPGWHLECSAMSTKYLGERFDIHGGGMDLLFPHHECEIAQNVGSKGVEPAKYWIHNNMITINGQKMGKSLGNFITLFELFEGNNKVLSQPYSPMTIRFFILQSHYRSPLDFSNEALQSAEKGLKRLLQAVKKIDKIEPAKQSSFNANEIVTSVYDVLYDDLNTPVALANLFEGVKKINSAYDKKETLTAEDLQKLKTFYHTVVYEILGLKDEAEDKSSEYLEKVIQILLNIRQEARKNKNFELSDAIRDELLKAGIIIKDGKDGSTWELAE
ncbi:MAG: cysteine--tRNA ligase [Bacteroidetes bacterium]|nr:MAG: cysteine--tRNA ligase [Bacteroidota bacterium]